ncbi:hypothetical protein I6F36_36480 [Bradyrhizobium sp. BRP19]|uniref:hypothetical protein n=1 Tax=Bradyrhizobium sp. BRP19 TaxID=2793823 RepID=UPI001CD31E3B|nr:hypothetical protein [Bradyrhizobium sp. BRP19]MCA1552273.1 hypothetical protein [Bradyrhizobium sp. BRP19]
MFSVRKHFMNELRNLEAPVLLAYLPIILFDAWARAGIAMLPQWAPTAKSAAVKPTIILLE